MTNPRILKLRNAPLSVAFSVDERNRVERAAHLSGDSVSAFIRAAAVKAADRRLSSAQSTAPDGPRAA